MALILTNGKKGYRIEIKPIKEVGTNYAEHYHSWESAIQKLIAEAKTHEESKH